MPSRDKLAEFVAWSAKHITGDEKGQAQIFLDRLFQAFGQPACLDSGGTAFADYGWNPVVLIEILEKCSTLADSCKLLGESRLFTMRISS